MVSNSLLLSSDNYGQHRLPLSLISPTRLEENTNCQFCLISYNKMPTLTSYHPYQ